MVILGPIDDARFYVEELNLSIIPCEFAGKAAKIPWKPYQFRLPTPEELEEWFAVRANIAVVTGQISKIAFVDIDSDAAKVWAMAHLPEPVCKTITGNGEQWPYRLLEGMIVGNRARIRGMKIDVRAEGGYGLVAPSLHPSGKHYERAGDWSRIHESPVLDMSLIETSKHSEARSKPTPEIVLPPSDKMRRAFRYVDAVPGAIQGSDGSGHTIKLVRKLIERVELRTKEEIMACFYDGIRSASRRGVRRSWNIRQRTACVGRVKFPKSKNKSGATLC